MADDFKRTRDRLAKHCCLGRKGVDRKLGNRIARHRLDERTRQEAYEDRGGLIYHNTWWAEVSVPW